MLTAGRKMMKIKKWFVDGREIILSLLFPPRCLVCDEILTPEEKEKGIHLVCESKLYPVKGAVCMHCGRPFGQNQSLYKRQYHKEIDPASTQFRCESMPGKLSMNAYLDVESVQEYCRECHRKGYVRVHSDSAIVQGKALYLYKGAIKQSMYRFKYANKREYAKFLAKQAVETYGDWFQRIEVIVPVPMYSKKQKVRGYNQAEIFARELSKYTGIPVDKHCVYRVKNTIPQKGLSDIERKNNLENAFQRGKSIVQYSHILIVDDIYTTGYTAEAVARELRKKGGCQIHLFSICIGGND